MGGRQTRWGLGKSRAKQCKARQMWRVSTAATMTARAGLLPSAETPTAATSVRWEADSLREKAAMRRGGVTPDFIIRCQAMILITGTPPPAVHLLSLSSLFTFPLQVGY